jgi:hypothetical protein
MNPSLKTQNKNHNTWINTKNCKAKNYALESQNTKSDLKSHKLGLYPMEKHFEPYSHLN